jgi:hypothetical protein
MKIIKYTLTIIFLLTGYSVSQSRTNLEVFYNLIDSSISLLPQKVEEGNIAVYTGNNMLLYNYAVEQLNKRYGSLTVSEQDVSFSYVIENAELSYGEIFRKKFLGDYYIQRNFQLKGNAVSAADTRTVHFELAENDTVKYDQLHSLENSLHPFTKAPVPAEPFFQGLIEPIVAIGTAATAVILFFIIRSK